MNACLEQVVVLNYATTQLEATCVLVTLDTNFLQTTEIAVVSGIFVYLLSNMLSTFLAIVISHVQHSW